MAKHPSAMSQEGTILKSKEMKDEDSASVPLKHQSSPEGPTAEQLSAARSTKWHQDGVPLLTIEDLRAWLNGSGLILYTPRPQQLASPAASLVEAMQGVANTEPGLPETSSARNLLARLIAEGVLVPLNLLGVAGGGGGESPDFVVSASVFSYIFTLRGNKAWKQPPLTSGPVKVSPLALAAYELLAERVTLSAYDLTTQLGKEVTEAAVLRALTELWSQLRVIPVPQQDGSPTLWELSTARFTKQIKAGANAGQPSALSALISLYLGQAVAATEEEVETFLSPLAPRSRVRDVLHALLAARQLETFAVAGKTLLHVRGDLPAFASATAAPAEAHAEAAEVDAPEGPRIRKFTPKPGGKIGTGLRSKPAFGGRSESGNKPGPVGRPAYGRAGGDRGRRPFKRETGSPDKDAEISRDAKPGFDKPWNENRPARRPPPRLYLAASAEGTAARDSSGGTDSGARRRSSGSNFAEKKTFQDRSAADSGPAPRKSFSKPGTFGRKRDAGKGGFAGGEGRQPGREFSARAAAAGEGERERSSVSRGGPDRSSGAVFKTQGPNRGRREGSQARGFGSARGDQVAEGGARGSRGSSATRKPSAPREEGGGSNPSGKTGYGGRPSATNKAGVAGRPTFRGKPSFGSRTGAASSAKFGTSSRAAGGSNSARAGAEGVGGDAPRKLFRKFDAPRGDKKPFAPRSSAGERSSSPRSGSGSNRPAASGPSAGAGPGRSSFAGKKSAAFGNKRPSAFAGKGGPFSKFADGKKPFRKPGKPADGGFAPTRRKRPEESE